MVGKAEAPEPEPKSAPEPELAATIIAPTPPDITPKPDPTDLAETPKRLLWWLLLFLVTADVAATVFCGIPIIFRNSSLLCLLHTNRIYGLFIDEIIR